MGGGLYASLVLGSGVVTLREKASGQWELLMLIIFCARFRVYREYPAQEKSNL